MSSNNSPNSNSQAFPNIAAPLVSLPTGMVNQAWLQFFITLWNRTGAATGNAGVPSGAVSFFAGSSIPNGYLLCDGTAVGRSVYPALFASIGTTWGNGDGSTTFNLPNLANRFLLGAGLTYAVAAQGGSTDVTLATTNLAAHNHVVDDPGHTHVFTGTPHTHTITDPGHHHTSSTPASNGTTGADAVGATSGNTGNATTGITLANTTAGGTNAAATTGVTTENTGSATPFSILPPYAAVFYIIKT